MHFIYHSFGLESKNNDIALIALDNYIVFNELVAPININERLSCDEISTDIRGYLSVINANINEIIAGYVGHIPRALKIISQDECVHKTSDNKKSFVTIDKFCVELFESLENIKINGYGLIHSTRKEDINVLRRVASYDWRSSVDDKCNGLFTNISHYTKLIRFYVLCYSRIQRNIPSLSKCKTTGIPFNGFEYPANNSLQHKEQRDDNVIKRNETCTYGSWANSKITGIIQFYNLIFG